VSLLDFLSPNVREALQELIEQSVEEAVERRLGERQASVGRSPLMTVPEAAELLRCSRQRVDDLLSQRRLTRFKDGRRTLVSRAEIDQYVRM
jgi:excisionase family DNA binding protein